MPDPAVAEAEVEEDAGEDPDCDEKDTAKGDIPIIVVYSCTAESVPVPWPAV
jgi:hypothetical protein